MKIIRVALDVPLDTLFDYRVVDGEDVVVGMRVVVPFGRRRVVGVIAETAQASTIAEEKLKPALAVLRDVPPLPAETMQLLRFCASYYHYPLGETILNALPGLLRKPSPVGAAGEARFFLTDAGQKAALHELPARALVKRKVMAALRQEGRLARRQLRIISPRAFKVIGELVQAGWVEEKRESPVPAAKKFAAAVSPQFKLTAAQQQAVAELQQQRGGFQPWLLHGVTGSGKTEVYLRLIAETIKQGGQALVLVPEINLTPQLESSFRARFPDATLAGLHSGLNPTERLHNWLLAQSGEADIVLGTRLAVFTPMPGLALIVVDEEHDGSFKQQEGLRYSARDVAVIRAKRAGIPVLLGSATPALETYYNARQGRYRLLELPVRAAEHAGMPEIRCIDVRRQKLKEGLSEPLLQALGRRLASGEQSLIFLNRRGYAPVLMCISCGWLSDCPRCSGRLVVHLREGRLRCHRCGHQARIPSACPECGDPDLAPVGEGTQRLESVIAGMFPAARILRVDRDSTRRKHALQQLLQQAQQADILIGTQMLAKGHDFPKLALVGVVNVDSALYSADFRASEKLFALLLQVSGRAGRASPGAEVLIQTRFPEHALFEALRRHDYFSFAEALLAERRQAGFPPFCHQALLRAEAPRIETALRFLKHAAKLAEKLQYAVTVYDPVAAAMPRLAGKERAQLLLQSSSRSALQAFLADWLCMFPKSGTSSVRWALDVDPYDF